MGTALPSSLKKVSRFAEAFAPSASEGAVPAPSVGLFVAKWFLRLTLELRNRFPGSL